MFFNDLKNEMRTLGIHKKKGTVSKDFKVSQIPKERSNFDVLASWNFTPICSEDAKGDVVTDWRIADVRTAQYGQ